MLNSPIINTPMTNTLDICPQHGRPYQFIGNDPHCPLNCRICYDCLSTADSPHRQGVGNHPTISIEQLTRQLNNIQQHSQEAVTHCNQALSRYFRTFETLINESIQKEKHRISKVINKILLAGITRDERRLEVMLGLSNRDFNGISCQQVSEVSQSLFNYVPRSNQTGFRKFTDHINEKHTQLFEDVNSLVNSQTWQKAVLKNIESQSSFFDVEEEPARVLRGSRVKTEEGSPKKTLRRSVRRQVRKMDLKEITVSLRRPLELGGTRLVDGKDEGMFLGKLFDHQISRTQLLYRASEYDFSVKEFHRLCDGEAHTLVLAKTEFNKIIGGFSSIPWKSTANTLHSDVRKESFLFSLSLKQKMGLIDQKSAIFNSINFGPTFGAGADLAICHNANREKTSYSQFPYSYGNNRYKECNQHSTALFTGQKNGNHFLLKEWEVWKISFQ